MKCEKCAEDGWGRRGEQLDVCVCVCVCVGMDEVLGMRNLVEGF